MARYLRALAAVAELWLLESSSGDSQLPLIPAWGLCASLLQHLLPRMCTHVHKCTHIHTQSWLKRNLKKWISSRIQRKDISNPGLMAFHIVLRKEGQREDQMRWVMAPPLDGMLSGGESVGVRSTSIGVPELHQGACMRNFLMDVFSPLENMFILKIKFKHRELER